MALKLDDDQARGHVYDDNQPSWYKPYQNNTDADDTQDAANKKSLTADELDQAERDSDDSPWVTNIDSDEGKQLNTLQRLRVGFSGSKLLGGDNSSEPRRFGHTIRKHKGLALGGGAALAVLSLVFVFLGFISSMKAVHFATNLRTTGFASSQLVIRKAFGEASYSHWAIENETAQLPKSGLLDRLRGKDMRAVQEKLVENGKFKYTVDEKGRVNGFDLDGSHVNFDELAGKAGKGSYADLSVREKMSLHKYVTDGVERNIGSTFDIETRSFRNAFWDGFREATGIKMSAFRDFTRDAFGNKKIESKLNADDARLSAEYSDVVGSGADIHSNIPVVEDGAEEVRNVLKTSADKGVRARARNAIDNYLKSRGDGKDIVSFEEGAKKVSTIAFVTSLYCMAHDLSKTSDRINRQNEESMARNASRQQTVLDQFHAGDLTAGDAKFSNVSWNGSADVPDASANALYLESTNQSPSSVGIKEAPRMNISLPLLDWFKPVDSGLRTFLSAGTNRFSIPNPFGKDVSVDRVIDYAVTQTCGVLMSPGAQGTLLLADLIALWLSDGVSAVASSGLKGVVIYLGFKDLGELLESYVGQAAGAGTTGLEQGSDKYSATAVGTDYLNTQTSRGVTYGRKLSTEEAAGSKGLAMAELHDYYNSGSFSERYLAISNPTSLLGMMVAKAPTSLGGGVASISSFVSHLASNITQPFKFMGSLLGANRAFAASGTVAQQNNYFGVSQWGWTTAEIQKLESTDMLDNAASVEQDIKRDPDYYVGLERCYSPDRLLYDLDREIADKGEDSPCQHLGEERALNWRIYKLQLFAVNQISSEGLNESN